MQIFFFQNSTQHAVLLKIHRHCSVSGVCMHVLINVRPVCIACAHVCVVCMCARVCLLVCVHVRTRARVCIGLNLGSHSNFGLLSSNAHVALKRHRYFDNLR